METAIAGRWLEAVFDRVPSRRLVVLGGVGAGKSVLVMKLARDLMAARQPGMAVPVIVPVATWDADADLFEWIAAQLAGNHPGLAARVKDGNGRVITLAQALADRGVVPILDGFDELSESLRAKAIAKINDQGSDLPLVGCQPSGRVPGCRRGRRALAP